MDPYLDPFLWTAQTFVTQQLLSELHPAGYVDSLIRSLCRVEAVAEYPGFFTVMFTDRLNEKGSPKLIGCRHRRLPTGTWASSMSYCDVEGFVEQHIQAELESWYRLVRAAVPDFAGEGRMHATALVRLVQEGQLTGTHALFQHVYDFEDLEIEVEYKDHLLAWCNYAEFTVWFLVRRFAIPTWHEEYALRSSPSFGDDAVAYLKNLRAGADTTNAFARLRPSFVQPYLPAYLAKTRDLSLLGYSEKEMARLLAKPVSTVKVYLNKVRKAYSVSSRTSVIHEYLRRGGSAETLLYLTRKYRLMSSGTRDEFWNAMEKDMQLSKSMRGKRPS